MRQHILAIITGIAIAFSAIIVGKAVLNSDRPSVAYPHPYPQEPYQPPVVDPYIPPSPRKFTVEDALQSITKEELKKNLYYLASQELEGRMSGKKGNVVAAEFIKQEYEKAGLQTMYDQFSINRMNSGPNNERGDDFTKNIYAWIEGKELPDEIIVVGAHMDHIGYGPRMSRSKQIAIHPGADDNASGTVSVMAVAKAFGMLKDKVKRTIVIQSYSGEEMGLIGSRYYCNNPKFPQNNPNMRAHVAMINLDMVGYLNKGQYFDGFYSGNSSDNIRNHIKSLNSKYNFADRITSHGSGGSDHASFYNKKVPIAFLHTGLHAYYHKPSDTADKINYEGIEHVARYTFELAWRVCQDENRPRFNYAGFKEMPYTHDHGHPDVPFPHPYHEHDDE